MTSFQFVLWWLRHKVRWVACCCRVSKGFSAAFLRWIPFSCKTIRTVCLLISRLTTLPISPFKNQPRGFSWQATAGSAYVIWQWSSSESVTATKWSFYSCVTRCCEPFTVFGLGWSFSVAQRSWFPLFSALLLASQMRLEQVLTRTPVLSEITYNFISSLLYGNTWPRLAIE